ncbi:TRAP transporter small permease [Carboxydothermus hydrogenoformans]|nr:TRAP transporter small permease [Carboxydothermus hydrogenoformans]
MSFLKKLDRILEFIEQNLVAILLMIMTAVVFWGVITRFVLKDASSWADEASRYLNIWAIYVGASLAAKRGAHIGVDAFVHFLPKQAQRFAAILAAAINLIFSFAIAYVGYSYTMDIVKTGQLSPAMRIPMAWAYFAVPFGLTLMGIRYLMILIENITGKSILS